jgi:hypothetical protein
MTTMTEEEKEVAAAYMKLHDDVKQLIVDVVFQELQNYESPLQNHIAARIVYSQQFKNEVKNVIKGQMEKY